MLFSSTQDASNNMAMTPSLDSYGWSVEWCRAFPSLLGLYCHSSDLVRQLLPLAWSTLYPSETLALNIATANGCLDGLEQWHDSLGYGEIDSCTVFDLLHWLLANGYWTLEDESKTTVVFDLGSGNGKVILATALFLESMRSSNSGVLKGIEIVPFLHCQAMSRLQTWKQARSLINDQLRIEFLCDDFTRHKTSIASEATLIWIHATVFETSLFDKVQEICVACRPGTLFFLVSRPLSDGPCIETILVKSCFMSWGEGMVYVQIRKAV